MSMDMLHPQVMPMPLLVLLSLIILHIMSLLLIILSLVPLRPLDSLSRGVHLFLNDQKQADAVCGVGVGDVDSC